ncbi:MAG: flagellar motor protein MotB [Nannocystaceae bacterium]|nr:flagellar motor protein MotB [Nannocystaceae bacterium]
MIRRTSRRSPLDGGAQRWTVSYSDFVTLLLAFFAGLYSLELQREATAAPAVQAAVEEPPAPMEVVVVEPPSCDVPIAFSGPPMPQPEPPLIATPEELILDEVVRGLVRDPALEGRIRVNPDSQGVRLSLGSSVLFEPGKNQVLESADEAVAKLGAALGRLEGRVTIEGHTDNTPVRGRAFHSNWELSTARATEVLEKLVELHGVDPVRLSAAGYGQYRPVATNRTTQGRALNRRIDVVVSSKRNTP